MICISCGYSDIGDDGTCLNCGEYNVDADRSENGHDDDRLEALEADLAEIRRTMAAFRAEMLRALAGVTERQIIVYRSKALTK